MPVSTNLVEVLKRYLAPGAAPIGAVYPPRTDAPNLPDLGGREIALRRFCDFLAALPFMRTMAGPAQPFTVPREQIHINQPKATVGAPDGIVLPYIAFLTSESDDSPDDSFLGPAVDDEDTADVYAPDTTVFWLGDHVEDLMLEVCAAEVSTRRAIVEGIKQVLRSTEISTALRLTLPDYFDQVATFTLQGSSYIEDQYAVSNRRRATLKIQLYMPEVMLGNALDLHVSAQTQVSVATSVRVVSAVGPAT